MRVAPRPLAALLATLVLWSPFATGQPRPGTSPEAVEPKLYADKTTGALLADVPVPANASGAPMTYVAGGTQYIVFPTGGASVREELIALTLP